MRIKPRLLFSISIILGGLIFLCALKASINYFSQETIEKDWMQYDDTVFVEARSVKPLKFNNPYSSEQLECTRILVNDEEYINAQPRLNYTDGDELKTDCESIKTRNFFANFPNTKEEAIFPIAFARNVFKDYLFLEMELAASYAPQNFYCYTLDAKADDIFKIRMRNLSRCFPNVFVSPNEFKTSSQGANINYACLECLKMLSKYSWQYVISLNNHDIIMRTNYEMVQIFKWFNGANDIMVHDPSIFMDRINRKLNWTFDGLKLFRNISKNFLSNGTTPTIKWAKGDFQAAVSRPMIDFMLNDLDLTKYMAQLEGRFAIDEFFWSILQANDLINAPGSFTHACLDEKTKVDHVTRYSVWLNVDHADGSPCLSDKWRHWNCVFGIEDIHRLTRLPHLFANKMMPSFDFGAMVCWYEYMFNRSHLDPPNVNSLNKDYYMEMPHIRYHHEKIKNGFVNMSEFDCDFKYKRCAKDLKCV